MSRIIFLFICLIAACTLQEGDDGASLWTILSEEEKQELLKRYNEQADDLWHVNIEKAIIYTDSAFLLAQELPVDAEFIITYLNKGVSNLIIGQYDSAAQYYEEALRLAYESNQQMDLVWGYYLNLIRTKGDSKTFNIITDSLTALNQVSFSTHTNTACAIFEYYNENYELEKAERMMGLLQATIKENPDFENNVGILSVKAKYYRMKGDFEKAMQFTEVAMEKALAFNDQFRVAELLFQKGLVYELKGDFFEAINQFEQAGSKYENLSYHFGKAQVEQNLGWLLTELGDFPAAAGYLYSALDLFERYNNALELSKTYNNLGVLYTYQKSYQRAEGYFQQAIQLHKITNNDRVLGASHNLLGIMFEKQALFEEAITNYAIANTIWKEIRYERGVAFTLFNQANIIQKIGDVEESLEIFLQAYDIEKQMKNYSGLAMSECTLANIYLKLGNLQEAKKYLDLCGNHAEKSKVNSNILSYYSLAGKYYEQLGNHELANRYLNDYIVLKDSVFTTQSAMLIANIDNRYRLNKTENELALLNQNKELNESQLSLQQQIIAKQYYLILAIIIGFSISFLLLIFVSKTLHKNRKTNLSLSQLNEEISEKQEEILTQNKQIERAKKNLERINENLADEVNHRMRELGKVYQELDTFFYRAAHDFRGPVTTFLGLAQVAKNSLKDEQALMLFDKVEVTAQRLEQMVNKLNALSLITTEHATIEMIDFVKMISGILQTKKHLIDSRGITIKSKLEVVGGFSSYTILVNMILDNVIENAIIFSKTKEGIVSIQLVQEKNYVTIEITDNGDGIEKDMQDKVYDLYVRAHENSIGNGLGLYIVRRAIDVLKGEIQLFSKMGSGTSFKIKIPNADVLA